MEAALAEVKVAFNELTKACVDYETFLSKETDLDAADAFLEQCRQDYITVLRKGNHWLKGDSGSNTPTATSSKNDLAEVASLLAMPKLSVATYDGNPVGYPSFIKVFEQSVKGDAGRHTVTFARLNNPPVSNKYYKYYYFELHIGL